MRRSKLLLYLLLLLTLLNVVVFIYRDSFAYRSFAGRTDLYAPCTTPCEEKWGAFVRDYPDEELAEARRISDSIVDGAKEPAKKLLLLAHFLYEQFHAQEGQPSVSLLQASPLQQFHRLRASKTEALWCGNYASMLAYFSWAQGIPSRVVAIARPGDQHILNECYLEGMGRWVLVDVTSNQLLLADRSGRLLDFQEAKSMLAAGSGLTAITSSGEAKPISAATPVVRNYYLADAANIYFHRVDNQSVYRASEKLRRYLLPVSWYDIYGSAPGGNILYWLKVSGLVIWIFVLFVFCIRQTKFKL